MGVHVFFSLQNETVYAGFVDENPTAGMYVNVSTPLCYIVISLI